MFQATINTGAIPLSRYAGRGQGEGSLSFNHSAIRDRHRRAFTLIEVLVVIGIHTPKFDNEKNTDSIRKAIGRYQIKHPIVNDADMKIWRRYGVPVYFYEAAARNPERRRLEKVRRAGFDGRPPDVGDIPSHPAAGACVVSARGLLIAFNVNLNTGDITAAQAIARQIRESSGGFRYVKAMGLYLATRGCAQISMNLTNFAETPLDRVYDAISEEAARLGTSVASCQLIGFVPRRAFEMAPEFFRRAENFDESRILETRIERLLQLN